METAEQADTHTQEPKAKSEIESRSDSFKVTTKQKVYIGNILTNYMTKLTDRIKNHIGTGLILGGLTLGGLEGCGLLPESLVPIAYKEDARDCLKNRPYKEGQLDEVTWGNNKHCTYIGEYMSVWKKGTLIDDYVNYIHGKGTLFDKDGKVLRTGYWNIGNPVDEDPLKERRGKQ